MRQAYDRGELFMVVRKRTSQKPGPDPNASLPPDLRAALERFPEIVREKKRRYIERQKFLKKTWGPAIRELEKLKAKSRGRAG